MSSDDSEIIRYISDRLYNRCAQLQVETDHLPETEFEAGYHMASKNHLQWLEELLSDIEVM